MVGQTTFALLFNNFVKLMSKTIQTEQDKGTEQLILEAAGRVFTRVGFAAARMEDIAREAGMNRALLHYYFRSKQKMFDLIFEENLKMFYANFLRILASDNPLELKIKTLVETEIDMLLQNQDLPMFILNEISQRPGQIKERIQKTAAGEFMKEFISQISREIKKGNIRKIEPLQLIINIMSLCIFPFIGRPMMMAISGIDQKQFESLMKQRKIYIADMILESLKK